MLFFDELKYLSPQVSMISKPRPFFAFIVCGTSNLIVREEIDFTSNLYILYCY